MGHEKFWIEITDRDRLLFKELFENRVMSVDQIRTDIFSKVSQQAISRRLVKLTEYAFIERRTICDLGGSKLSVYLNTQKAIKKMCGEYGHRITSELCKSDSVEHDLRLVDLRRRFMTMKCVTKYHTENVLQSCHEFSDSEDIRPFVIHNTDAVLEIEKNGKKITIGLEFENSEKAFERYTKR